MNQERAEWILWFEASRFTDWLIDPDDWYEAMAALMAERGPA